MQEVLAADCFCAARPTVLRNSLAAQSQPKGQLHVQPSERRYANANAGSRNVGWGWDSGFLRPCIEKLGSDDIQTSPTPNRRLDDVTVAASF